MKIRKRLGQRALAISERAEIGVDMLCHHEHRRIARLLYIVSHIADLASTRLSGEPGWYAPTRRTT